RRSPMPGSPKRLGGVEMASSPAKVFDGRAGPRIARRLTRLHDLPMLDTALGSRIAVMSQYLFKNFAMLDPEHDELRYGHELLVEADGTREVAEKPICARRAAIVDGGGRPLMRGLIDSHVHVVLSEVSTPRLENVPLTLMTARAAVLMRGMLDRGFT